jgi:hypothetical protein
MGKHGFLNDKKSNYLLDLWRRKMFQFIPESKTSESLYVKAMKLSVRPTEGTPTRNANTMKAATHPSGFGPLMLAACLLFAPGARAGLTVDIHSYHDVYGYFCYAYLNANTNTPNFPTGNYLVASPQYPVGGSRIQYQATNNTLTFIEGGGDYYDDFDSLLYGITNGQWSIWVTNATSTNQYNFTVTVTGLTSNGFGAPAVAVYPPNGASNVTSQPLFLWTGPANWAGALDVSDTFIDANGTRYSEASSNLPPNQTSWQCPVALPNGTNDFYVDYTSNVTAFVVASIPISGSQTISAWTSTATLESHFPFDPIFTVNQHGAPSAQAFNAALNTTGLAWSTSGDASWFVETTNTSDGVSAAQSGIVTNNQASTLSVTLAGPGMLTFYWASQGSGANFDYECYMDGDPNEGYVDDIAGNNSWYQDGPFLIPAGQHNLSWTLFAYGDDDLTEAGFLDQVSFAGPVDLSNPQTVGTNFQFQFPSQAGFSYGILYRTNLVVGNWQTYSSVAGNGSLMTISVPLSVFSPAKQAFICVSTQ